MVKQVSIVQWAGTIKNYTGTGRPFTFSGTANNGLGSPPQLTSDEVGDTTVAAGVKILRFNLNPPPNPIEITLPPVSLNARIVGSCTQGYVKGNVTLQYTATVIADHPHPTNFHETARDKPSPGVIHFKYVWSSTDGDTTHLSLCYLGEWVSYDGNALGSYVSNQGNYTDIPNVTIPYGIYFWPDPPYDTANKSQGSKNPGRGKLGWITAEGGYLDDTINPPPFKTSGFDPNNDIRFYATQVYGFRCTVCMNGDPPNYFEVLKQGTVINRSFRPRTNTTWTYDVSKDGLTSDPLIKP